MANENLNLPVLDYAGKQVGEVVLPADLFNTEVNEYAVQRAVRVDLSNRRVDTAHTLTRDIVHGSNRKPFRQKGTGRARAGSTRSPIWVGGGQSKAPDGNQNYTLSQNRKAHDLALKSALTLKAQAGLLVLESLKIEGKTKEFAAVLSALKADKKVLVVTSEELVWNAAKNVKTVTVRQPGNVSVYDLLNANFVVVTKADIEAIEEDLK